MSFEEFMLKVNDYLNETYEVDVEDLPDLDYYNYYESGRTPRSAALAALRG